MSMGHSVAAKGKEGVRDALSMTIPLGTGIHRRKMCIRDRYIDLFSGIGGFREGLTRAGGITCVGHCEIDKKANQSYEACLLYTSCSMPSSPASSAA